MRRGMLVAAVAAAGSLAVAGTAQADTFTCTASVVRVTSPLPTFEPFVADDCGGDSAGVQGLGLPPESPAHVSADLAYAATATDKTGLRTAQSTLTNVVATVGQDAAAPDLTVKAQALFAQVSYRCVNGTPTEVSRVSHVAGLTVNDSPDPFQQLTPDDGQGGIFQITNQIAGSPLAQAVNVIPNADDAKTGVRRALRIELLAPAAGAAPTVTIDLAEAGVKATCDAPAPTGNGGGGGSSTTTTSGGTTTTVQQSTTQTQAPAPAPADSGVNGSSTVVPVVINGRNGGCGKVAMWFTKVDKHGNLKGHPRKATSRFGNRVVLRGVLRSCSGKPIVGARLDVIHEFAGRKLTKTGLKSRSGGKLTLILPMNLSSRALTIAYRGDLAKGKITSKQRLRLTVRDRKGRNVRVPPRSSLR